MYISIHTCLILIIENSEPDFLKGGRYCSNMICLYRTNKSHSFAAKVPRWSVFVHWNFERFSGTTKSKVADVTATLTAKVDQLKGQLHDMRFDVSRNLQKQYNLLTGKLLKFLTILTWNFQSIFVIARAQTFHSPSCQMHFLYLFSSMKLITNRRKVKQFCTTLQHVK